jgi:hypothetical protein
MNSSGTKPLGDDAIPLLTEVLEHTGLVSDGSTDQPASPPPETLEAHLQRAVLERLRAPEFGLEAALMEHFRPMVERASRRFASELNAQLQATLAYVTDTAVERAVREVLAARDAEAAASPAASSDRGPPAQD